MSIIEDLRRSHARYSDGISESSDVLEEMENAVEELLSEPTNVQALALARLMRDRPKSVVRIYRDPFDLPEGSWCVMIDDVQQFVCGIAPDGSVSS